MKRFFKITVIIGVLIYAGAVVVLKVGFLQWDHRARAMSAAVDLALGIDEFFPDKAISPNLITDKMREECLSLPDIALMAKKEQGVEYATAKQLRICYGVISINSVITPAYYRHCGIWWFQDCIALGISTLLYEKKDLLQTVEQVLEAPCKYLPTEVEVEKVNPQKAGISQKQQYNSYRKYLGCDTETYTQPKLTISIINLQTLDYLDSLILYRKEK